MCGFTLIYPVPCTASYSVSDSKSDGHEQRPQLPRLVLLDNDIHDRDVDHNRRHFETGELATLQRLATDDPTVHGILAVGHYAVVSVIFPLTLPPDFFQDFQHFHTTPKGGL